MIGKVLNEKYVVLEVIAEGGMATVYKAVRLDTGEYVAIKVLKPEYYGNKEYVQNFKSEMEAQSQLHHKNIVQAFDSGIDNGMLFFVMEYVPGKTLKEIIDKEGAQGIEESVQIALKICMALQHAHVRGIIHRDLKPQNILISDTKAPMLTDFGIAHKMGKDDTISLSGRVLGSVNYFSPEQAKGEKLDERSDIYSLGIMLYELTTGKLPFYGDEALSVALKHIHQKPTAPKDINPEIPESLNRIILKAISKDKKNRYASVQEMYVDLEKCLAEPDGAYVKVEEEFTGDFKPKNKKKRIIITVCSIIGVLLIAIAALFIFEQSRTLYVPSISGTVTETQIKAQLEEMGLLVETVYERESSLTPGTVINISPSSGSAVERGSVVKITVVDGDQSTVMPALTGLNFKEALDMLNEKGVTAVEVSFAANTYYKNETVITQTPDAMTVITDKTTVHLDINRIQSKDTMIVPTLKGLTIKVAAAQVSKSGINKILVYTEKRDNTENGKILEQQPNEGSTQTRGSNITVWLQSLGESNYSGVLALPEAYIEEGDRIMITVRDPNIENVELIQLETRVENRAAFLERYKDGIPIRLYLDSNDISKYVTVIFYKNGQEKLYQKLELLREVAVN